MYIMNQPTRNTAPEPTRTNLFDRENYIWIIIGIVVIAIGLMLMAGGKSADPNVFLKDEVYSFRRITLAPIIILLGFAIEIYAIFRKPRRVNDTDAPKP